MFRIFAIPGDCRIRRIVPISRASTARERQTMACAGVPSCLILPILRTRAGPALERSVARAGGRAGGRSAAGEREGERAGSGSERAGERRESVREAS